MLPFRKAIPYKTADINRGLVLLVGTGMLYGTRELIPHKLSYKLLYTLVSTFGSNTKTTM